MKKRIKYSILIPNLGYSDYLLSCLDSVTVQKESTSFEYEIIICDQSDKDDYLKIMNLIKEQYKNVTLIHLSEKNVSKARHELLLHATGDYIYFIDSDDYINHDALFRIDSSIRHNSFPDLLITNLVSFNDSTNKAEHILIDSDIEEHFLDYFFYSNKLNSICIKIFKKGLYNPSDYKNLTNLNGEDFVISYPLVVKSKSIVCDKSLLIYHYRKHNNSRTSSIKYSDCEYLLKEKRNGVEYRFLSDYQKEIRIQSLVSYYIASVQNLILCKSITKDEFKRFTKILSCTIESEKLMRHSFLTKKQSTV